VHIAFGILVQLPQKDCCDDRAADIAEPAVEIFIRLLQRIVPERNLVETGFLDRMAEVERLGAEGPGDIRGV